MNCIHWQIMTQFHSQQSYVQVEPEYSEMYTLASNDTVSQSVESCYKLSLSKMNCIHWQVMTQFHSQQSRVTS